MLNVAKLPVFDYSALRLRNAEFRQAFKSSATKGYSVYSTKGLRYPGEDIFSTQTTKRFAAYRFGCFARVDRFGHLCNQCCFKLLDIFQVITFWQLEWIVFCNAWGAVKHLCTLWFWRKDREVVKVQRFETVRAKLAVSGACPCSNPIMVYLRTYQQDVLNVEGRNIAFWDL